MMFREALMFVEENQDRMYMYKYFPSNNVLQLNSARCIYKWVKRNKEVSLL